MEPVNEPAKIPAELTALAVARSLQGLSPREVRDWPGDDVLDQLQWMHIEALLERRRERERGRVS